VSWHSCGLPYDASCYPFLIQEQKGHPAKLARFRIFAVVSLVPLCVFFAVSFKKAVRPHWYLSFLPFAYVAAALVLDNNQIVKCIKFSLVFSLVQVCLVLAAPFAPAGRLKGLVSEGDWASLVMHMRPQEVLRPLEEYEDRFILATNSYCISALLEYYGGERVIVFGKGSRHGRQDDILTNFKELEGRDIVILRKTAKHEREYKRCFERTEVRRFKVQGTTFSLLVGYGFNYQEYRETFLRTVLRAYYRIPDWLPGSGSFFHEKYDFRLEHEPSTPEHLADNSRTHPFWQTEL
jgi:hypothetical protein